MSTNLIALQNKFLGHGQTVYDKLSNLYDKQGFISDDDILQIAREFNLPPPTRAFNGQVLRRTFTRSASQTRY